LYVSGDSIRIEFDKPISVPLASCGDMEGLKAGAATVWDALSQNATPLPNRYLIQRFVRLAIEKNGLAIRVDAVMLKLDREWGTSVYTGM
jgi:hypothetical protein